MYRIIVLTIMATKAKNPESEVITIPRMDIRTLSLRIVGDTPLIMHRVDEKFKKQFLDDMLGTAKTKKRDTKDPFREFLNSMYWLDSEKKQQLPDEVTEENLEDVIKSGKYSFGFPSTAFKNSAAAGAYRSNITKDKVSVYGAIYIIGEFVTIKGIPRMREDIVKLPNGMPDIRYRGCFDKWETNLTIRFNTAVFSAEQVANLFNLGGFAVGVGEWRPEKKGQFGMFHVE